jgi:hypothetical protein
VNREGAKNVNLFSSSRHSGQVQREPESSRVPECNNSLDFRPGLLSDLSLE